MLPKAKYKGEYEERRKILTPKKIYQRLPIALAQVKAGNTSENLLDEIRLIICFLYQSREIINKVYNNNEFNKIMK